MRERCAGHVLRLGRLTAVWAGRPVKRERGRSVGEESMHGMGRLEGHGDGVTGLLGECIHKRYHARRGDARAAAEG